MKKFTFLLSLSAAFTTVSFALTSAPQAAGVATGVSCPRSQKPVNSSPEVVGEVTRVEGLVTVSQGNTLGNAFKNEVVLQNARLVSTANGSTTIRLNNCCVINLKPNEAVTVDFRRECKAILASIQPAGAVGSTVAGGAGAVGSTVAGGYSSFGFAATPQILGSATSIVSGVSTGISVIQVISKFSSRSSSNSALQRLSGS